VTAALEAFAAEVGADGPVTVVGGRTQWEVGGPLVGEVRQVAAPAGVVAHEPGEMIVRVRAGTTVADLQHAVSAAGQSVWLEAAHPETATVGGVLAVGRSGPRRLGRGPIRDAVLEVTAVDARGRLIRSGAPLVKNVTGFDLCRLLVGSLGTLAFMAEVVLRCRPAPEVEAWWVGEDADPFDLASRLYRPLSVLWDGTRTWVGLAGYRVDVEDQAASVLGTRFVAADGPPPAPAGGRRSVPPGEIRSLASRLEAGTSWLAEVGTGIVHLGSAGVRPPSPDPDPRLVALHRALKDRFDPANRLSPGRSVIAA
jgi:glycolate oxidase FAD binding subunit